MNRIRIKEAIEIKMINKVGFEEIKEYYRISEELKKLEDKTQELYNLQDKIEKKLERAVKSCIKKVSGGWVNVGKNWKIRYNSAGYVYDIKKR